MRLSKKLAALAVGTIATVAVAGGAFAYWTTSGIGSGAATVGTDTHVSIDSVGFTGNLYPGSSVPVDFIITNHMPTTAASVGQVVADEGVVTAGVPAWPHGISGVSGNCLPGDFTFSSTALSYLVPADGTSAGTGTLALSNSNANQDDCKTAHPVLHLSVGPHA